jgi:hypothetical protein
MGHLIWLRLLSLFSAKIKNVPSLHFDAAPAIEMMRPQLRNTEGIGTVPVMHL